MVTLAPRRRPPWRRGELTLAAQFLLLQLLVVAVLLGIVGALSVRQSTAAFTAERGGAMRSVAEYLANIESCAPTWPAWRRGPCPPTP